VECWIKAAAFSPSDFLFPGWIHASPIAACLDDIATEGMGLDENPEHSKKAAEWLLAWKTEIDRIRQRQS
jgi:hypothetical protein